MTEEFPDDLILLNQQDSIFHVNQKFQDYKNLNGAWRLSEDIIFNPALQNLCTSTISNRTEPKISRSLSVTLIDCGKFPWYFKRYTQHIIKSIKYLEAIVITESDTDDDCIILADPGGMVSVSNERDCPVHDAIKEFPKMQLEKKLSMLKKIQRAKRREEKELQRALKQKNKDNIDIKRNKGLVGLTITRKIIANDVAPEATIDKSKQDTKNIEHVNSDTTYLNGADKMLSSCGTDLIAVIEDSDTLAAIKDHAYEIAKNVVTGSDSRSSAGLSESLSNTSVKCTIDINKKLLGDISKKKMDNSEEKIEKRVYELNKAKTSASVVAKDSSSKMNINNKHLKDTKSKKHVKDKKKTNKYINEQMKNRQIDFINKHSDVHQKYLFVDQTKSNKNFQKAVSKDFKASSEIERDTKKIANTTDKNTKGFGNGSSSPILTCNSSLKKHKSAHNVSNKMITERSNQNILKTSQNEDKRKTGQNESVASPDQNTARNKIHYYSLSYQQTKNKNPAETENTNEGLFKSIDANQKKTVTQDIQGPSTPVNNSPAIQPIHILSVDRINNNDKIPKERQLLSVGDGIVRLPHSLSQYPACPLNGPSQNGTNHLMQLSAIPNTKSIPPKHFISHNVNMSQVQKYKPSEIFRSRYHYSQIRQFIPARVNHSRSSFSHYRAPLYRGISHPKLERTPFMFKNSLPPNRSCSTSSVYHHTTLRSPTSPIIPSVTSRICRNPSPRNCNVPINNVRTGNNCNIPLGYGNNSLPQLFSPQPPPPSQSSHHSSQQTPIQSNPPQNKLGPQIYDNKIIKNNAFTAREPPIADYGGQVPKEGVANTPKNHYFKTPASIILETLEPVESKIEMLEELDKVTIEDDFEVHLERHAAVIAIPKVREEIINTTPKDDPQPKRAKTDDKIVTTNDTRKKSQTLALKGYSPPILPIPRTLEEILMKVKSGPLDNAKKYVNVGADLKTSTEKAKKISLDEYKKRTYMNDATDYSDKKIRSLNCKHGMKLCAKNHRLPSVDSDHGYDSDTTMIL